MKKLSGPCRLLLPEERPHGRRAAALAARLPEVHADRRQRDLRGPCGHRPRFGDPGRRGVLRPGSLVPGLYITNGDALDDAYHAGGHPRLRARGHRRAHPGRRARFEFEDDEQEVQEEFLRHPAVRDRPRRVGRRSGEPRGAISATRSRTSTSTSSPTSYGDPRPDPGHREAVPQRDVKLHYRINGGREQKAGTPRFRGGERFYKERGVYYHRLRGVVEGTRPGDQRSRPGSRPRTASGAPRTSRTRPSRSPAARCSSSPTRTSAARSPTRGP